MEIIQVKENKKKYLDLLLLADEQEDMVDRYLERGDMFVLSDGSVPVSYTHLDVYKRQTVYIIVTV